MAGKKKATTTSLATTGGGGTAETALIPYNRGTSAKGMIRPYVPKITETDRNAPAAPEDVEGWQEIQPEFDSTFHFEKVGDYLKGQLVDIKDGVGQNEGRIYVLLVGAGAEAQRVAIWEKKSLELKMKHVQLKDRVFIQLIGMRPSKNYSNPWYDFRVRVAKG